MIRALVNTALGECEKKRSPPGETRVFILQNQGAGVKQGATAKHPQPLAFRGCRGVGRAARPTISWLRWASAGPPYH